MESNFACEPRRNDSGGEVGLPTSQRISVGGGPESWEAKYQAGLAFLGKAQLPSGEFPVLRSTDDAFSSARYVKAVFTTAVIAYSLGLHWEGKGAMTVLAKAREYLAQERDADGWWRFLGRDSPIPPDLDDTAYALLALGSLPRCSDLMDRFLLMRDSRGLFLTWVREGLHSEEAHGVDWVVNANVLLLLVHCGVPVPQVSTYLLEVLREQRFTSGTTYYPSPHAFLHAVSRLANLSTGPDLGVEIVKYSRASFPTLLARGDPLSRAFAMASLINCGYWGPETVQLAALVLDDQENDGGWRIACHFREPRCVGGVRWASESLPSFYYGSRETTTAFCLEAIALYRRGCATGST